MTYGIPIRLSASLATRAREVASVQDRSLTDQVEHWARLGQAVEATVLSTTVERLKALSYDEHIPRMLAAADTPAGRRRAARAIAKANPVRYGTTPADPTKIVRVERRRKK